MTQFFLQKCTFFLPEHIKTSMVGPKISLGLSYGTQEGCLTISSVLFSSTLTKYMVHFQNVATKAVVMTKTQEKMMQLFQ